MIADIVYLMLVAALGVPLAATAHELTHVAVVWPVAHHIEIDPSSQTVTVDVHDTRPARAVANVAGYAPVIIGTLGAIASAHAGMPWPAPWTSPRGLALWGVWVAYAVSGGLSDYLPSVSRGRAQLADD